MVALSSADQFRPGPPPALTAPLYSQALQEVQSFGTAVASSATAEQMLIGKFWNGAMLNLEATRFARGRKNQLAFEINGSRGSLAFDLEEMNRLRFYDSADPNQTRGFRDIIVTESNHPYVGNWWPPGHIIGYEHSFVHTVADFVKAIVARKKIEPDFTDGLKTQRVLDAIQRARPLSSL